MARAGNALQLTRVSVHPSSLNIRAIIIFSVRGSERYFFTVGYIYSDYDSLLCSYVSLSFAVKTGCFVFHLSLITQGPISHHHPEKAQLHRILKKRSSRSLPSPLEMERLIVWQHDQLSYARFLKIEKELSVLLWAQGWKKYTNLLVTTSGDTVGRSAVNKTLAKWALLNTVSVSLFSHIIVYCSVKA